MSDLADFRCVAHAWDGFDGPCPYCRISRLEARVAELEEAGTIALRLLLQERYVEALEHANQNFKP